MDNLNVLGKCLLEINQNNDVFLVIELNNGEIRLYKECNTCYIAIEINDTCQNCNYIEIDEGYFE